MIKKGYRREPQRRGYYFMPLLFFFCIFPFFMSRYSEKEKDALASETLPGQVWIMQTKFWGDYKMAMEEYLIGMMAATIPVEYEMETLKAQAILLRSFCLDVFNKIPCRIRRAGYPPLCAGCTISDKP